MEVIFPIVFIIAISELIASGTWQKFYFTQGLSIFKQSVFLSAPPKLSVNLLNEGFTSGWFDPLRFKEISPLHIAFRESLFHFAFFKFNYSPVMRGLIYYDDITKELQVVGYLNWYIPVFFGFFIFQAVLFFEPLVYVDVMFLIFPIGLFALLYFIQYKRFMGVFKALSIQNA